MKFRLEKYLYYLLLFSIPFQTRKILYYSGWRFNEWQSISVYATDVLLGILFVFWAVHFFKSYKLQVTSYKFKNYDYFLFAFIAVSAISIKNSSNYAVSWFQFLKLVEFAGFYFYLKSYAIDKFGFEKSLYPIFIGGIFQSIIAVAQFIKQSDLGLKYLGESFFNVDVKGVASFYNYYGDKVIRAYGTTPHPNVLAAYLFLTIFCFYFIWLYKKHKYENVLFYFHLLVVWALFCTFARVTAFLLGANYVIRACLMALRFPKSLRRDKVLKIVFFIGSIMILFTVLYWPEVVTRGTISGDEDAVQLRVFYNKEAVSSFSWTGTGIGDFVNELESKVPAMAAYLYQPVHNIYLLIYAETGILGISMFILFLTFLIKDFITRTKLARFHHYSLLLLFLSFLFMGLFDHFLWTIQQGRFVLWIAAAAIAIDEEDDIKD